MNPLNGYDVGLAKLSTTDQIRHFHLQWEDHYRLQQSGSLTDLLLLAGDLLVPVHQAVLVPLSPLLSHLVSPPCCWQTVVPTLSLPGVDTSSVLSMVRLLYTGRCNVSTVLEYSKLVALLDSLGIHIQQTLVSLEDVPNIHIQQTLVSLEEAPQDQPLNLSVCKTESEDRGGGEFGLGHYVYEGNEDKFVSDNTSFEGYRGYSHKKFRGSIITSLSSGNHTNTIDVSFENEVQVKTEDFPEDHPENETQYLNKMLNPEMTVPWSMRRTEGMDPNDLMEWINRNVIEQENPGDNVAMEGSYQSDQVKEVKDEECDEGENLEKPGEEFMNACESCGMQFISDKLVSYILHQKECPKSKSDANPESSDVNLNNAEAKTSMMSKALECPHCDEVCSSMVDYVAHLDNCQKNNYFLDVNNSKQLEIANEISIDEEELDDSQNADENPVEEDLIMPKDLNNRRSSSSKSCQICSDVFLPPYHLKMHYTERHFYKELSERIPLGNLICDLCERKFSCRKALILHIGATHEVALDLLSKKLVNNADDYNNKIRIYGDKDDSFDELIIDLDNDPLILPQELKIVEDRRLKCENCHLFFNTNYHLQAHYSKRHYKVQLEAEYAGEYEANEGLCSMCNKTFKSLLKFIQHMGAFHNEVSKYIGMASKESNPLKGQKCLTCPISLCQLQFTPKYNLVLHLTTSHYLNEVNTLSMTFWTDKKTCPMCEKSFPDFVKFRNHLSVTHNMIEKFYSKSVKEYMDTLPTNKRKSMELVTNKSRESENKKIKSEVVSHVFEYFCHRCDKRFPNLTYLLNHLTLVHYREKLTLKFAKAMKTNVCNICKVSIESTDANKMDINKMLRHIGVTHRRVLSCLPKDVCEKLNEKTSERAKMCFGGERQDTKQKIEVRYEYDASKESLVKVEDNESIREPKLGFLASSKADESIRQKVLLKGEDRFCQICNKESSCLSSLLLHLTTTHFRSDLRKEFQVYGEKYPKQCPFCQKEMLTSTSFLSHVGTTHRKVIEYAPWIEESPEGQLWFSNNKGSSTYRDTQEDERINLDPDQVSYVFSDTHFPKVSFSKHDQEASDINQNKKARYVVEAFKPVYGDTS